MVENIQLKFKAHIALAENCISFSERLNEIAGIIYSAVEQGQKVFWYGNGGSAADSQHMAAELVSRFKHERKAIASIALSTDTSIITAIGNDYSFDNIFSRQIEALAEKGDICIGLSTSGNSKNVHKAHMAAQKIGAITISLLGNSGGLIKNVSDESIVVPSSDTPRIQEMHTLFSHIICGCIEDKVVEKEKSKEMAYA